MRGLVSGLTGCPLPAFPCSQAIDREWTADSRQSRGRALGDGSDHRPWIMDTRPSVRPATARLTATSPATLISLSLHLPLSSLCHPSGCHFVCHSHLFVTCLAVTSPVTLISLSPIWLSFHLSLSSLCHPSGCHFTCHSHLFVTHPIAI